MLGDFSSYTERLNGIDWDDNGRQKFQLGVEASSQDLYCGSDVRHTIIL